MAYLIDGSGFITHLELEIKIKDIDMTDDEQSDGELIIITPGTPITQGYKIAFNCPKCGAVTYTKTSKSISSETRRSYHQCQNMLCGYSFMIITSVEIYLTKIIPQELPEGFEIPRENLPRSHRGEKQMEVF